MGANLEFSKILAGEGSILLLLGLVPYAGWLLAIIGIILFLKGSKELANYYHDSTIYENAMRGFKLYIIALVSLVFGTAAFVLGHVVRFLIGNVTAVGPIVGSIFALIVSIVAFLISFVAYVLAANRLRRTFVSLANHSGERSFATAGTLLWWGALTSIVLVGFVLIFIAWIFAVIGFFSMRSNLQPPSDQPNQGSSLRI